MSNASIQIQLMTGTQSLQSSVNDWYTKFAKATLFVEFVMATVIVRSVDVSYNYCKNAEFL